MAVTGFYYGKAFISLADKLMDLDDGNVRVMLCTSLYTPNQDVHDYKDDVTDEVTGTGYTAGGKALMSPEMVYTAATNVWNLDAYDTVWETSTITARYAVIYYNTGVASTSPLLCYIDFGENKSSAGGDFKIEWAAGGICKVTVA